MKEVNLKVCLLNDSFPPTIDGVANTVVNYANVINEKCGTPIVLTPKYPNIKDNCPYPVIRYPSLRTQKFLGYRAGYPFSNYAFHKVEKENIDIIHSHCPFISTMIERSLQRICNVPLVFTYHTKFDIDIRNLVSSKLIQESAIKVIVDNIHACDEVWVVSEGAGQNLRSLGYKGDYIIMDNGVDFPKGKATPQRIMAVCQKYKLRQDAPKFFFAGRMRWSKGIDIILNSIKRLKDLNYDFQMIFAGDGLDFIEIKRLAETLGITDKCVFCGAIVDREELRALFSVSGLFLFPSVYDTNGIVVREAAACAVPSILINGSCAAEGVADMENGFLIENSVESMVAKIEVILKNPSHMIKVGENAQKSLYLSWEDSVLRATDRYRYLIDNYKPKTFKHTHVASDKFYNVINHMYDIRSTFYKDYKEPLTVICEGDFYNSIFISDTSFLSCVTIIIRRVCASFFTRSYILL